MPAAGRSATCSISRDLSYVVVALFCAAGAYAMALLLRACVQVEPFLVGDDDRQPDK
jgi:hypothetical protein